MSPFSQAAGPSVNVTTEWLKWELTSEYQMGSTRNILLHKDSGSLVSENTPEM